MALLVIREEMSANYWEQTEIQSQCVNCLLGSIVLVWAWYRMFKSTEPLSSDSPAETDEVRRFPRSANVIYILLINTIRQQSRRYIDGG